MAVYRYCVSHHTILVRRFFPISIGVWTHLTMNGILVDLGNVLRFFRKISNGWEFKMRIHWNIDNYYVRRAAQVCRMVIIVENIACIDEMDDFIVSRMRMIQLTESNILTFDQVITFTNLNICVGFEHRNRATKFTTFESNRLPKFYWSELGGCSVIFESNTVLFHTIAIVIWHCSFGKSAGIVEVSFGLCHSLFLSIMLNTYVHWPYLITL